jgi:hypothetical protein
MVCGCAALWDQQRFKQIVVRAYAGPAGWTRPVVNLLARLSGLPALPRPGRPIPHLYFSHLAVDDDRTDVFAALFGAARGQARAREASYVIGGFAEAHPFQAALAREPLSWTYRSMLYSVHWPDAPPVAPPDGRPPHHEVALL